MKYLFGLKYHVINVTLYYISGLCRSLSTFSNFVSYYFYLFSCPTLHFAKINNVLSVQGNFCLTLRLWCWSDSHTKSKLHLWNHVRMIKGCYFAARDGGRHGVVHWSDTASTGAHKQVMFLQKSGHQKRTSVVRGDMGPDSSESDIHPLSQAAHWYRHLGSVKGGSNKLHQWMDQREIFNTAWEWSNMVDNMQDQRNFLVPFQVLQWIANSVVLNTTNCSSRITGGWLLLVTSPN